MISIYLTEDIPEFNKEIANKILKQSDEEVYDLVFWSGRNITRHYKRVLEGMTIDDKKEIEELAVKTSEIFKKAMNYAKSYEFYNYNRKLFNSIEYSDVDIENMCKDSMIEVTNYFATAFATYFYMNLELIDMSMPQLELAEAIKAFTNNKAEQKKIIETVMPHAYHMFDYTYYEECYEFGKRDDREVKKEYDEFGLKLKSELGLDETASQQTQPGEEN